MNKSTTIIVAAILLTGCSRPAPPNKATTGNAEQPERPSFATVLIDYSASFAPLEQNDRLALKEASNAIADLAVQEWTPPTTIVWRRIGSVSTAPPPLCEVMEYKRSIIGAVNSAQELTSRLSACAEAVVQNSRVEKAPEPYTDIGSAIMIASQSWASLQGKKALIILSDMKEDLPQNTTPTSITLHGEIVLLLHRPGTTETDPAIYLDRITTWEERLKNAGATTVRSIPTFRATDYAIKEALTNQPDTGTSISIINDLATNATDDATTKHAITTVASAIAKTAANSNDAYPPPVAAGWFRTSNPAWRMTPIPLAVYKPRLVHRNGQINTVEDFTTAIEELGLAAARRPSTASTNLDESLALITSTDRAQHRALIILSDFTNDPPSTPSVKLRGNHALLIYRSQRATNGATFFQKLRDWQSYLRHAGATSVCALDMTTFTTSAITTCLQ